VRIIILSKVMKYVYDFELLNSHYKRDIFARLIPTSRKYTGSFFHIGQK